MPIKNGAQLIVEDILKETKEKSASIVQSAKKDARTLLDAARVNAREEEERKLKEARAQAEHIREELLAEGRMRARRELLRKREEFIDEVIKEAEKKLLTYASSGKYKNDLIRIAAKACKKLGSSQVVIQANQRDLKHIEKSEGQILQELGELKGAARITLGDPIQTIGGVRIGTHDGKVEIDETFEGKMRREIEALRVKVAKVLSEGSK